MIKKGGEYKFVIFEWDNHANLHKDHQVKPASEMNAILIRAQPAVIIKALEDPMVIRFEPIDINPSTLKITFEGADVTKKAQIISDKEVLLPWPEYPDEQSESDHLFSIRVEAYTRNGVKVIGSIKPIDFNPQSDDPEESNVHIRFFMLAPGRVRVKVYALPDDGGNPQLVRTFEENKGAGEQEIVWDGKADDGFPVWHEADYQCDVYRILPDGREELIISIDPEAQLRLGGIRRVISPKFKDGIYRVRVYVPTGGTLTVKLWGGAPEYTMRIFKYANGKDIEVPQESGTTNDGAKYVRVEVGGSDPNNPATYGEYCVHVYRNGGNILSFTIGSTFVQIGNAWDEQNFRPWIGWWWPAEKNINAPHLYDQQGPLDKYDAYVEAKTNTNPNTRNREMASGGCHYRDTPNDTGDDWWGHCHAFVAASIWEKEPRKGKRHVFPNQTIDFSVGDLKGLLTAAYHDAQPDDSTLRPWRWYDDNPATFHNFLSDWIRGIGRAVKADIAVGRPIYFHALYKYIAYMVAHERERNKLKVTCRVFWQVYSSNPSALTPTPPCPDSEELIYWLKFQNSRAVDGQWDKYQGVPDYMEAIKKPTVPGCGGVELNRVYEIIQTGSDLP